MAYLLAHHSGRYDNMKIKAAFDQISAKCSVISHTEFANNKRASALKAAADAKGWGFYQHNRSPYDECCFTWNKANWELVDSAVTVLSDIPWYSGATGNKMPDFSSLAVLLKRKGTNEKWIFITCHTPSHVAIWNGFRPTSNRIKCYQDGIAALGKWCSTLIRKWHPTGTVVAADWNAPAEQKWFRDYLEKNFPSSFHVMGPNATFPQYPDTHDNRCIDWPMLGGNVQKSSSAKALSVVDSDHKTLIYSVRRKD